jgi:Tol biopolymer transport system component
LVPGVTDACEHVYLKTLATGAIRVVDTNAGNEVGNACNSASSENSGLAFSPDGQWLLFCSSSTNLIQNAPRGRRDVLGKNLATGDVEWFGPGCSRPMWSPDGTLIAYMTDYEFGECGAGWPNNGAYDIVVIERSSQLTDCADFNRVSSNDAAEQPIWNGPMDSERPVFSPDSTKIAFSTQSPFLVPNDTNKARDILVKDLTNWQTTRVSTSSSGAQAAGDSEFPAWSPDGTRIAFHSGANTLVAGDTNVREDIFVKTLGSGALQIVSTRANGEVALFEHRAPSWSPDSSRLAWMSQAVDLVPVPNDTNARPDVFVKDLSTGFVQLVSSTAAGLQGDNWSSTFSIAPGAWSKDGTRVLFTSSSQNLSATDGNAFAEDLFVKTVG